MNISSTDDHEHGPARELILELICRASHLPQATLAGQAALRQLGFDSLRHFQLMLEIETRIGREFDDGEVDAVLCCATIDDLCSVVSRIAPETAPGCKLPQPRSNGQFPP